VSFGISNPNIQRAVKSTDKVNKHQSLRRRWAKAGSESRKKPDESQFVIFFIFCFVFYHYDLLHHFSLPLKLFTYLLYFYSLLVIDDLLCDTVKYVEQKRLIGTWKDIERSMSITEKS
jgi:hypothetical protein